MNRGSQFGTRIVFDQEIILSISILISKYYLISAKYGYYDTIVLINYKVFQKGLVSKRENSLLEY